MPGDIRQFQLSVPAGTPKAAPVIFELAMPPRLVSAVHFLVPPGPRGELGFALGAAGQPIIPYASGTWIVTDDERIEWPLDTGIDSGAWELFAYNTGTYPHTIFVTFLCTVIEPAPAGVAGPSLSLASLAAPSPATIEPAPSIPLA